MLKFYGYKIYTNNGRSALVFRRMGQEPEVLCELPSEAPEARAELNRRLAFEALFTADTLDRGALGDLEHCTRRTILDQVEKMLDNPEIKELLGH